MNRFASERLWPKIKGLAMKRVPKHAAIAVGNGAKL
jgi:hypothetical protein